MQVQKYYMMKLIIFVFHDIDLIPENKNSYKIEEHDIIHTCKKSILNRNGEIKNNDFFYKMDFNKYYSKYNYRYYNKILGGITLIKKNIWKKHNWNEIFDGYGFEDMEYYNRLLFFNYKIYQSNTRYISLHHKMSIYSSKINNILNFLFYKKIIKSFVNDSKDYKNYLLFNTKYKILYTKKNNNYTIISIDFDKNINHKKYKILFFFAALLFIWPIYIKKILNCYIFLITLFSENSFLFIIAFNLLISLIDFIVSSLYKPFKKKKN